MKHVKNIKEVVNDNSIVKVVSREKDFMIKQISSEYKSNIITSLQEAQEFLKNKKFADLLILDMDLQILETYIILSLWKKSKNTKLLILSSSPIFLFPEYPTYNIQRKIFEIRYLNQQEDLINMVYETHSFMEEGDFIIYTLKSLIKTIEEKVKDIPRKIVVTSDTNLKHNSIISFDTLLENRIMPTLTGGAKMSEEYISQRDANLRTSDITYRFISEEEFNNLPYDTPEIVFRLPLHHMMIDIYNYGLDPFEILTDDRLDFVFSLFIKYNIVDYNYKITRKGKLLRSLPFGIRPALLCLEYPDFSSVVLASCIENFSNIFIFSESDSQSHIRKYFERFRGQSDIHTLLNIYKISKEEAVDFKNVEKWARDNYISYEYLKNFYFSIEKVCKILNIAKGEVDFDFQNKIADIYIEKEMSLVLDSDTYVQYMDYKGDIYTIDSESINRIDVESPLKIYGLVLSDNPNAVSLTFF